MEKSPIEPLFVAKLEEGEIIIFDQNLNILNRIQSSLDVLNIGWGKSDLVLRGNKLITCGSDGIEYWDISESSKCTDRNKEQKNICTLALLPNNKVAAAGGSSGLIYIMGENGEKLEEFEIPDSDDETDIFSLLWVEGSESLWVGDRDGYISIIEDLFHPYSDPTIRTLPDRVTNRFPGVLVLEERESESEVFSGGSDRVVVWDYDGTILYEICPHEGNVITSLSFSGENIIMGDGYGYIEVWNATSNGQSLIATFRPHRMAIHGRGIQILNHLDHQLLCISGSADKTIILLDPIQEEIIKEIELDQQVRGMAKIYTQ